MHLGIGIGLGFQNTPPQASSPEEAIKAAIKERNHVTATLNGTRVLLQPYALLRVDGNCVLRAVEVAVEGGDIGGWAPKSIKVTDLANVEIYNLAFIPSDAFDASILDGVVAVVDPFDPFENAKESGTD